MPQFYQALLTRDPGPLARARFPALPKNCAWFTFLRLHDEVTLDLAEPKDRADLVRAYTKSPEAAFRHNRAFSGRLFDLLDRDPQKVLAAWSLLVSLPGTPILYYGDEIAMENNWAYFEAKSAETGFRDSRFLHRGPWDQARACRAQEGTGPEGRVKAGLDELLGLRKAYPDLAASAPDLTVEGSRITSVRRHGGRTMTLVTDLADFRCHWSVD
jgi:maltose alpha-D-glucosyltransferase/alpha-amylase